MNGAKYRQRSHRMLAVAVAVSLIAGIGACRRANEGSKPTTTNPAATQGMSNPGVASSAQGAAR